MPALDTRAKSQEGGCKGELGFCQAGIAHLRGVAPAQVGSEKALMPLTGLEGVDGPLCRNKRKFPRCCLLGSSSLGSLSAPPNHC